MATKKFINEEAAQLAPAIVHLKNTSRESGFYPK